MAKKNEIISLDAINNTQSEKVTAMIKATNLSDERRIKLEIKFNEYSSVIQEWNKKEKELIIESIDDTEKIAIAEEGYKYIKKIRIQFEKFRKEIKEEPWRECVAIDNVSNLIKDDLKPIEDNLKLKADYAKLIKEKQEKELSDGRILLLTPYMEFAVANMDYGKMSDEDFNLIFNNAKLAFEAQEKIKEERNKIAEHAERTENRKLELMAIGLVYNQEQDSMVYMYNDAIEFGVQIPVVIENMSDEDWLTAKKQTATRILEIQRNYKAVLDKANKNEEELTKWKEEAANQKRATNTVVAETKKKLAEHGISYNVKIPNNDRVVLTDKQKMERLLFDLDSFQVPVLDVQEGFLFALLNNTTKLIIKTRSYLEKNLAKLE